MINGLDNVYYFVTDITKALDFYQGILGLEVVDKDDEWASISLNGVRLGLHKAEKKDFARSFEKRSGATVTMNVDDIDRAHTFFVSKGVKFHGPIERNPWGSHVSLSDPDGNLIDLRQAVRGK